MSNSYFERYKCPDCGANLDPGETCFDCAEAQKKAAPELEPPKAASKIEHAPIVTGAEENVKEGQHGLLQ